MKLLVLDSNSLTNRAFYAMPNLTDSTGRCTGGIYGFMSMLNKLLATEKPTHIAAAFDLKAPTFRHKMYADYKAGRKPMPEELKEQFPILKDLLRTMNIKVLELEGYEADDILGTLSTSLGVSTVLVSGDKDVLQLVSSSTDVILTKRGITDIVRYTPQLLSEQGLTPQNIVDLKSLMGDNSDNIPGVPGIGEKTALNLVAQYKSLDGVYSAIDSIGGKLQEKLINGKESAYMSHTLATINREVPLNIALDELKLPAVFPREAERAMISMDFKGLVNRFDYEEVEKASQGDFTSETKVLDNQKDMQTALDKAKKSEKIALEIGASIYFAFDENVCYKVETGGDLFSSFMFDDAVKLLSPILSDNSVQKLFFDSKFQNHVLYETVKTFVAAEDLQLMLYVLDAGHNWNSVSEALKFYGYSAVNPASEMWNLYQKTKQRLAEEEMEYVYREIELPLVPVLFDMENAGFRVDTVTLNALNDRFGTELAQLERTILSYSERPNFNINSPKQLSEVLFDELKLPGGKKRSTDVDSLKYLLDKHPIIAPILRYRRLSKLISTYLSGLTCMIAADGKLHTVFKQALTTTGRLSSTQPNLQNIPVRTEEGKEIRAAFVPSVGNKLVVADYSQIELRLLAHFSGDQKLIDDFNAGKDIHASTAASVFGVDESLVTSDMRRRAKAVNFGIIYGISDFGLSESIGCSIKEAKEFIENYFSVYPTIKSYMENIKKVAAENGYVSTFTGRKRYIPELSSTNYNTRSFGERAAMNMPLQGSASDIIKLAMIKVKAALVAENLSSKLIMQVHDELIIDAIPEEVEKVKRILRDNMQGVAALKVPLIAEIGEGDNWLEAK